MVTLTFEATLVAGLYEELKRASGLNNLRLYKMVRGLLWVHEGKSLREIAGLLQVEVKTVENWLKRFMVSGFGWLCGKRYRGRGRKGKLTRGQQQSLRELVEAGPEASGFDCGVWNSAMIAELIWRRWEVSYNPRYLSTLLHKLGLSYQKACFISDRCDEDEYEKARQDWVEQTWPALLAQAKASNAVILFTDEASFAMWGSLGRTWAPRGQQPRLKTTGQRKGLKIFGAIDCYSGAFYYHEARAYKLTAKALKALKNEALPAEPASRLEALKGLVYATQAQFVEALQDTLGTAWTEAYQTPLLEAAAENGKFNTATYLEFLTQLLAQIDQPIILVEDSVSYHRSQAAQQFQAQHADRLHKVPLPTFSPDFNPIEKLWKNTKRDATHLKYFKSFDDLRASVLNAFRRYLEDAAKVIGVMKKLRAHAGLV